MKEIKIIAAQDLQGIIGHGLNMPGWNITDDYKKNFVPKTIGNPVIMGSHTAESLLILLGGPFPKRTNIVLSRDAEKRKQLEEKGFFTASTIDEALEIAEKAPGDIIWNTGGGDLYRQFLALGIVKEIHLTIVDGLFPGEAPVTFPAIDLSQYKPGEPVRFQKRLPSEIEGKKDRGNSHDFQIVVYEKIV